MQVRLFRSVPFVPRFLLFFGHFRNDSRNIRLLINRIFSTMIFDLRKGRRETFEIYEVR